MLNDTAEFEALYPEPGGRDQGCAPAQVHRNDLVLRRVSERIDCERGGSAALIGRHAAGGSHIAPTTPVVDAKGEYAGERRIAREVSRRRGMELVQLLRAKPLSVPRSS